MSINTCDKYSFDKLVLENPKKVDDLYLSNINYVDEECGNGSNKSSIIIQTPKLIVNKVSKKLTLFLNEQMENLLNDFDSTVISLISEKSEDFFEEKFSIDDTEEIYKHSFKQNKKETKILVSLNKNLTIYNKHKEQLNIESISSDDTVICLLKCKKIVFYKNYCEPLWEVTQIKLKEQELDTKKYLFIEDKNEVEKKTQDEDDDDIEIKKIKIKS